MSYPVNVSFKDSEFAKISPAAARSNKEIRAFVKDAALKEADAILAKEKEFMK